MSAPSVSSILATVGVQDGLLAVDALFAITDLMISVKREGIMEGQRLSIRRIFDAKFFDVCNNTVVFFVVC